MKVPLQITVRNVSVSEVAKENIRQKASKLDAIYDKLTSCRVLVEAPHRHHRKGLLYNVRIDLTVPGSELVVKREPNEDIYVAIRDAFDAARRQLQDYVRRQRGDVKAHEELPHAVISKLFLDEDYGFLEGGDGRTFYFHKNSVLNGGFSNLSVGTPVRFSEEAGEKGPQASTVVPLGKAKH